MIKDRIYSKPYAPHHLTNATHKNKNEKKTYKSKKAKQFYIVQALNILNLILNICIDIRMRQFLIKKLLIPSE